MTIMNGLFCPFTKDWFSSHRIDALLCAGVFAVSLLVFLRAPVHQIADTKYQMLVSDSLIRYHSFDLDHYAIPHLEPVDMGFYVKNGDIYQLEWVDGHIYHLWPPAIPILAVPFVAVAELAGRSPVNPDGTYNADGETAIQAGTAAFLMATLAVVFLLIARLVLPIWTSVIVTGGAAFGTQILSTASRGIWSETWGILILSLAILLLLAADLRRVRFMPVIIATLLAWTYFCRPTFWLPIVAISLYVFIYYRRDFLRFALVGGAWAGLFVLFSWCLYRQLLPNYYHAYKALGTTNFTLAFTGNLVSPSRGLFIYVPVLLFIFYLLARFWRRLPLKPMVLLAIPVVIVHMVVVSMLVGWYGGHCYGPRYSTGIIPWFFVMAIGGVQAWTADRSKGFKIEAAIGSLLLLASIGINTIGAASHKTSYWNVYPVPVDYDQARIWDWNRPQFLAPWQIPDEAVAVKQR